MAFMKNIMASQKSLADNGILSIAGEGAPTSATGIGVTGKGSLYYDRTNGVVYRNDGDSATPVWSMANGPASFNQVTGTISAADIVRTTAGGFGHANGYAIVPAPAAGTLLELISAVLIYDFGVAAYTTGGNTTVNWTGGAANTGLISAANFAGASADKLAILWPLAAAGLIGVTDVGFSLVSSAGFVQPGTATGVIRYKVSYRSHLTGL